MSSINFRHARLCSILFAFVAVAANAAMIDSIILTANGPNTDFAITGTYAPGTPVTPFRSPNSPYSLTFSLPTTPAAVLYSVDGFAFVLDADVTVNGVNFATSQVVFFNSAVDGGLLLCLGTFCNPDPNVLPYPAENFWNTLANQAYSGPESNPTFLAGDLNVNSALSFYVLAEPVPEPATVLLTGIGVIAFAFGRRRSSPPFPAPPR